jgi:exosortase
MTKQAKHQFGFAALCVVALLGEWRPLVDTFSLSLRDYQYTYLLLILPFSAALIVLESRGLRTTAKLGLRAGSVWMAIAAVTECLSLVWPAPLPSDAQLSMRMLALALWCIGAFLLCFGTQAARRVLFPLGFLLAFVPLPRSLINLIGTLLQQGSVWAAHSLFSACGVPVFQDGVLLTIPGITFQVAQECSSIRSSSMLLITSMVIAHLLLRSPWRRAVLIAFAVPLSIAKNGLRIFTIAMLGTRVDPAYLTGRLHHDGGAVFFAIVLLMIFALLWALRRGEGPRETPSRSAVKAVPAEG